MRRTKRYFFEEMCLWAVTVCQVWLAGLASLQMEHVSSNWSIWPETTLVPQNWRFPFADWLIRPRQLWQTVTSHWFLSRWNSENVSVPLRSLCISLISMLYHRAIRGAWRLWFCSLEDDVVGDDDVVLMVIAMTFIIVVVIVIVIIITSTSFSWRHPPDRIVIMTSSSWHHPHDRHHDINVMIIIIVVTIASVKI